MNTQKTTVSIGFPLTTLLIILKMTDTIDWSWLWVLAPIWLPLAIIFGFAGIAFLVGLLLMAIGVIK